MGVTHVPCRHQILVVCRQRDFRGLVVAPIKQYTGVVHINVIFGTNRLYTCFNGPRRRKIPPNERNQRLEIHIPVIGKLVFFGHIRDSNRYCGGQRIRRRRRTPALAREAGGICGSAAQKRGSRTPRMRRTTVLRRETGEKKRRAKRCLECD